jgi:TsgA-like MFS transporter
VRKLPATLIAIGAYAIMSGFLTQGGVILRPAALEFGRTAAATAPLFSYLLGGNLIGFVLCLVVFDVLSIKRVFTLAYAVLFAGVALIVTAHTFAPAAAGFALAGFGAGIGLSCGAVIITRTYAAHRRAAAFLGTDCAFSVAGFVFPAVASFALGAGGSWHTGYVVVAVCAALLLVVALIVPLPDAPPVPAVDAQRGPAPVDAGARVRVALFAAGLCLYLCGQSTFLTWAPLALAERFALPASQANAIVGTFWGPSIIGLLTAGVLVSFVAPRAVLACAASIAAICTLALALTWSASAFFVLTLAFGLTSTCMYKLMISIGSEQVLTPSPRLVTLLLLAGAVGGMIAPALSGRVVAAFGLQAGTVMTFVCYAGALAAVLAGVGLEAARGIRRVVPS